MPSIDLICLANSYKYGHRCIAGLHAGGGGWLRPVSAAEHGELSYSQFRLPKGAQPAVLDLIRIGVAEPRPRLHQPEDWLIDSQAWQLLARPAPASAGAVVAAAIQPGHLIFGDGQESIALEDIERRGGVTSLTLVRPEKVWWRNVIYQGWKRARVAFRLGKQEYDLPLTDPAFVGRVKRLELGDHLDDELPITPPYLFTISLSEPFGGRCYKLVTSVAGIPTGWETRCPGSSPRYDCPRSVP